MSPVISDNLLPAELAARVPEATRKSLAESPREKRLGLLAADLGLGETATLEKLARAAGLR